VMVSALTSISRKPHSDRALGNLGICLKTCCNYNIECQLLEVANMLDIVPLCDLSFNRRYSICVFKKFPVWGYQQ
jgi:hypothetical protein